MVNTLTDARNRVSDALMAAGLKAYDYISESFTTPACFVLPDSPYVTGPVGSNPFGNPYSIRMQVLVVGGKGTNKTAAEQIDSMLVSVIDALDEDWEITEVQAPQEVTVKTSQYLGALVLLEQNTHLEKEVM